MFLCAITVFVTKNEEHKKKNAKKKKKQYPMTISYFMALVTKIFTFLGDNEDVPSIDPASLSRVPIYVHSSRKQREMLQRLINS